MRLIRQFLLLVWKNYLLQKRKPWVTLLEVGLPTLFALILIFIRQRVQAEEVTKPMIWSDYTVERFPSTLVYYYFGGFPVFLPWRVAFTPDIPATRQLMNKFKTNMGRTQIKGIVGFKTEDKMVSLLMSLNKSANQDILGGIVFTNDFPDNNSLPRHITYKIRLTNSPRNAGLQKSSKFNAFFGDTGWKTQLTFPLYQRVGPREKHDTGGGDPGYMREGFLTLQQAIDWTIIETLNPSVNHVGVQTIMKRFPYPPYNNDAFVMVIQQQFPLVVLLSFVFVALQIVKDVVHEKERKLKESMKMMGLSGWLHWMAWFFKYFTFLLISVSIMTLFYCVKISVHGAVISYTDASVILIFLMVFSIATINFSFMISTFFNKANSGAAAGGIIFFCSYVPYFFLQPRYSSFSWAAKMATCLISNVAMAYGAQVIGMFEGTGEGIHWSNIHRGVSVDDDFALLHVMIMLLADSVLYALITWYVEAVYPGNYGVPQPWYFPFLRSYWCGTNGSHPQNRVGSAPLLRSNVLNHEYFEKEPVGMTPGIQIRNLTKVFGKKSKRKVAVSGMTLNMYEGQITALLGHNGAGKTTTMSMLTGFIPPSSGTADVNGCSIQDDISSVRSSLGLCPQHDVLFDTLTVEEHLRFFVKLKGCPSKKVKAEVEQMLADLQLLNKRKAQSKALSGGMKRKLSVGIALIGGSKVVILDEPTSGMDPHARRQTWSLLQQHRKERTMLLSTHFMDEADVLGDRIAIMASGHIQCCGSALFLKNKYGAGYHMVIVKEPGCDVDKITEMITSYVPSARIESNVSAELSFILPQESSNQFEGLFTELQESQKSLGIASFGASVTTMEEVFLRVGEYNDESLKERLHQSSVSKQNLATASRTHHPSFTDSGRSSVAESDTSSCVSFPSTSAFGETVMKNTGVSHFIQQFYAMFLKRVIHTWRNSIVTATQLLIPLFFTIMSLIVLKTLPLTVISPPLVLDLGHFPDNVVTYGDNNSATTVALGETYKSQFVRPGTKVDYVGNVTCRLIDEGVASKTTYNLHYILAASFFESTGVVFATAHFNNQPYHTPGISMAAMFNTLVKYFVDQNSSITTINHPLPPTAQDEMDNQLITLAYGFTISFNIMFGMSFLASSFVLFLIRERAVKAKHSQFVSGVQMTNFWLSTFAWDFINYMIPCMLLIMAFLGFGIDAYVTRGHWLYLLLIFILYGWAMLPFMYLLSFIFTVPSAGFVWLTMFNILSGIATVMAVTILSIKQLKTESLAHTLEWFFLAFLPNYCLGRGVQDLYSNYQYLSLCMDKEIQKYCTNPVVIASNISIPCCKNLCGEDCIDYKENYLDWESLGIGREVMFLALQGVFYFFMVFLIESQVLRVLFYVCRPSNRLNQVTVVNVDEEDRSFYVQEDSDVLEEASRIRDTTISRLSFTDAIILRDLTKSYGPLMAVNNLTVGIPRGECFGLLGINGAGKTSTFKMLTGDTTLTAGDAFMEGYDVKLDMEKIKQLLGYCPQFDALIDQMTGRETLYMYARLRGVREEQIPRIVCDLLDSLMLDIYADRLVSTYSGGNKRKLSTAIALIGDPPIIFLDEPTTGMDPVARRLVWDKLSKVRASGKTLVLTSHSMEECEALCTRIAIMVNGQFRCLGSPQHLKNKFGEGYTLLAKVSFQEDGSEPNMTPLMNFIEATFPDSVLKDIHQGMLHYHVTDTSLTWAQLFGTMEMIRTKFSLQDYSISQTTLEQVFINFARAQLPPKKMKFGRCGNLRWFCPCSGCCRPTVTLVDAD